MTRGRNPFIDLPPFDPDSKFLNSIIDTPKGRTLHAIRRTVVHLVTSFTPSFSTVDALFGFTNRAI
jgi:hypothetical protein